MGILENIVSILTKLPQEWVISSCVMQNNGPSKMSQNMWMCYLMWQSRLEDFTDVIEVKDHEMRLSEWT